MGNVRTQHCYAGESLFLPCYLLASLFNDESTLTNNPTLTS
jgi:hypothetical protein